MTKRKPITPKRKATGIKILVTKSEVMPTLRYARATWKDCCNTSCDSRGHYPECITEKAMIDRAFRELEAR